MADAHFRQTVDQLISTFYDDIGTIVNVSIRSIFDLFVIKALYVERGSRDAAVVDYLGEMLARYLYSREMFPLVDPEGKRHLYYFSDLLQQLDRRVTRFQNLFETYRKYADNALFLTGIFPRSFRPDGQALRGSPSARRPRRGRLGLPRLVDRTYYVSTGKTCYRLAAEHELAEFTQQRPVLNKLSDYFEVYMDALNEMSDRYILGFDMNLIADKMLDNFNLYRRTGHEKYLDNAQKYAALLKVNESRFPGLFRRRHRPHLIQN